MILASDAARSWRYAADGRMFWLTRNRFPRVVATLDLDEQAPRFARVGLADARSALLADEVDADAGRAVFLALAVSDEIFLKLLGVGMATAIFLDATVVRMVLVPALMHLFGRANWWIPRWLDRALPRFAGERAAVATEEA